MYVSFSLFLSKTDQYRREWRSCDRQEWLEIATQ